MSRFVARAWRCHLSAFSYCLLGVTLGIFIGVLPGIEPLATNALGLRK